MVQIRDFLIAYYAYRGDAGGGGLLRNILLCLIQLFACAFSVLPALSANWTVSPGGVSAEGP